MKNQLSEIAPRLRSIRNRLRISQRSFAGRLKISLSHYSKLESAIGGISDALLLAIAAEAGIDPQWLKNGSGTPPAPISISAKQPAQQTCRLSLEQIEQILLFTGHPEIRSLAERLAASTGITFSRALATLAREHLHSCRKKN